MSSEEVQYVAGLVMCVSLAFRLHRWRRSGR